MSAETLLDDIHRELGHDALVKWDRALVSLPEDAPEVWQNQVIELQLQHPIFLGERAVAMPHLAAVFCRGWFIAIWDGLDWHRRILPRPGSARYGDNESLDAFERRVARARPQLALDAFLKIHGAPWDPEHCGACRRAAEYVGAL